MKLAQATFPCKDCRWVDPKIEYPLAKRWCLYNSEYMPIKWDSKTGYSCDKKERETHKQLEFAF